ncbi:hypothetical protein Y032_0117g631 [Ancylostoma ceylanicum]|uniref:Uncharacterized protein n=1 Tax=Ancylostoma ceylanicum TaxID=53326 RepID=A0A016TBS9_9BILA|nr:hypothetical protein Y032_0117g631 [Ancylostoma ceylanicum]
MISDVDHGSCSPGCFADYVQTILYERKAVFMVYRSPIRLDNKRYPSILVGIQAAKVSFLLTNPCNPACVFTLPLLTFTQNAITQVQIIRSSSGLLPNNSRQLTSMANDLEPNYTGPYNIDRITKSNTVCPTRVDGTMLN